MHLGSMVVTNISTGGNAKDIFKIWMAYRRIQSPRFIETAVWTLQRASHWNPLEPHAELSHPGQFEECGNSQIKSRNSKNLLICFIIRLLKRNILHQLTVPQVKQVAAVSIQMIMPGKCGHSRCTLFYQPGTRLDSSKRLPHFSAGK